MGNYNEIVIECPKIAGLYINLSQFNRDYDQISLEQLRDYAKNLNLPIYAIKDGKIYTFDIDDKIMLYNEINSPQKQDVFEVKEEDEISIEEVLNNQREIDNEEKYERTASVIEKNPFRFDKREEFELIIAFKEGDRVSVLHEGGYESLLSKQDLHRQRIEIGLNYNDPGTAESILQEAREFLAEYRKMMNDAESEKSKKFFSQVIKKQVIGIYGFALNAKEKGDMAVYDLAKNIINEFGSFKECASLIAKRLDTDGSFKILDTDIPFEIRERLTELKNS